MELNKFGAVLTFAIEMEERSIPFYESLAQAGSGEAPGNEVGRVRKRLSRLERMRRELVNEMMLEPIRDFHAPDLPDLGVDRADSDVMKLKLNQRAEELAATRSRFYADAAEKLSVIAPAVTRAFKRMA